MAQQNPQTDPQGTHHSHDEEHHILPASLLLKVFGTLVALTILTVLLATMERAGTISFGGDLGSVGVALLIAGVKATLVAMYFMLLKYDNKLHAMAFTLSILILFIFFVITYFDTGYRGEFDGVPDARPLDMIQMDQMEAEQLEQNLQQLEPLPVLQDSLLGPAPVPGQ